MVRLSGDKALDAGLMLARLNAARVIIVTATDPVSTGMGAGGFGAIDASSIIVQLEETYAKEAKTLLAAARAKADAADIEARTLYMPRQKPADAIMAALEAEKADTIVMGSHGRRGFGRLLLGSQAAEVLAHSSVPVLTVK
ncbi:Nucleotide-binding universal stress protein, UspA family [Devosia crocina]|uniref:Nucleotide-binding universal stress protein, UspA family n=1 Tax=Devosia crocina TaxID=429728 RepID=A0A1I7NSE6_9HYPH|nr:universal stress protein [Devosia crocina]SFV37601.1 Nucleotide-binding universal stress protein, UspA family [Devosia crocina]